MSVEPPPLQPYSGGLVRVWTGDEAAAFDRRAIDDVGVPQPVLMENAGRAAAMVGRTLFAGGSRGAVVALVGSGNNGGDALVALRSLAAWGHPARAVLVADRPAEDPLLHGWPVEVSRDVDLSDDELDGLLAAATLVLDGILGTGVRGAPRPRQARVIEALDRSDVPVVSLDVPSGVDATTGATPGAVVRADATVAFGAPKLGALLHPARAAAGRHIAVEIGFPPLREEDASAFLATPRWAAGRLPRREGDTHKNRVGRVVVVGGGTGMAGAAILAGRAAFRAGAGLVQIATAPDSREAVHGALPEAIVVAWSDEAALHDALEQADAVAVGPGMGRDAGAAHVLGRVLAEGGAPVVLDADGLNLAAEGVVELETVAAGRPMLITPHAGEMRRLVEGAKGDAADSLDDEASRPEIARWAVRRFGCSVLLKGAPSLVAAPGRPLAVDTQTSSDLAVAGMGDTLTGACAALLAQGLATPEAGALGLYLTGRAARLAGRGAGLTPSDVAEALPGAMAELSGSAQGGGDASTTGGDASGPGRWAARPSLPFVIFDAPADR